MMTLEPVSSLSNMRAPRGCDCVAAAAAVGIVPLWFALAQQDCRCVIPTQIQSAMLLPKVTARSASRRYGLWCPHAT